MRFLSGRSKKEQSAANNVPTNSNDPVEVMVDIDSKPSTSGDAQSDQASSESSKQEQNKNVAEQQTNQLSAQQREQQLRNQQNGHDQQGGARPKGNSIGETTSLLNNNNLNEPRKQSSSSSVVDDDDEVDEDQNEKISHKSILKRLIKKFLISFAVLLVTYLIGYFGLSFAWILICQVLYFICLAHRIRTKNRLLAARELENEEKVTVEFKFRFTNLDFIPIYC